MTALLLVPGAVLGAFALLYGTTLLDRLTVLPAAPLVPLATACEATVVARK